MSRLFRDFIFLALVLLFFATGCQTGPMTADSTDRLDPRTASFAPPAFDPPEPRVETLSGGAKVFLLEDHDIPLVRLFLTFRGGSVHDPAELAGLAELAGAVWRGGGTLNRAPEEFDDLLDRQAVGLNVGLSRETGSASLNVLAADLELGLDLLAELLYEPGFDEERLAWARERLKDGIVRERDEPGALAYRALRAVLYKDHPRSIEATAETVDRISREELLALHEKLLTDSGWVIGAVGDFDSDELLVALEARFGKLPGEGKGFPLLSTPKPPEPQVIIVPKDRGQTTLVWARFGPAIEDPDRTGQEVADFILGGSGFQSRLMRKIRSDSGLVYGVGSFYSPHVEFGVLGVSGSTATVTTAKVWQMINEIVAEAGAAGFSPEEVVRARETVTNQYLFRYRDPAATVRRRASLWLNKLPADLSERLIAEIGTIEPEAVSSAAAKTCLPRTGVWVLVGDVNPEDPAWAADWKVTVVEPK